jgi:short-subunit dehydrogenase
MDRARAGGAQGHADADAAGFRERYGPWALVAGGSLGLGAEWTRQLAERGLDLVVVAESPEPLIPHCEELARRTAVEVVPVVADLGEAALLEQLRPALAEREVGLLVYNAAHSHVGPFLGQPLEDKLRVLDVNCRGLLLLVHQLAPALAARGRGGIAIMSSLSALQGTALVSTYAASKAFDLILAEALWEELRRYGVDVLAVVAGAIRTPGWEATQPARGRMAPPVMEPAQVVREALDALDAGPSRVIGRANRWLSRLLLHAMPRRRAVASMGRSMRALYRLQAGGEDSR